MKLLLLLTACLLAISSFFSADVDLTLTTSTTLDSLGACQGVRYQQGKVYLYGDREVGVIRTYTAGPNALTYTGQEVKLTNDGQDVINHPTGIAWNGKGPTFIGNSIRPNDSLRNPANAKWRAIIYCVDWEGLLRTKTLDGNLINTIEDDACIQGTRPEYVQLANKWYVATADYGEKGNEVRLYDPERLARAKKTSEPGVVVKKFTCTPLVQNLHWIPSKGVLVLIQNQIEGRRWRFTFVDLKKSLVTGQQQVIKVINTDNADELEGFALLSGTTGVAVTSARTNNVHFMNLAW